MSTPDAGQAAQPETLSAAISQSYDELAESPDGGAPANAGNTGLPVNGTATDATNTAAPTDGAAPSADGQAADPAAVDPNADAAAAAAAEVKAPETWPEQVRQEFDKHAKAYPQGAQWLKDQISFMQGQYKRNAGKIEPYVQMARSLDPVLAPGREERRLNGMDDVSYISRLAAADNLLSRDPVQGLLWIAEQVGIDINTLGQQQQQVDPQVRELMSQVNELKAHLNDQSQQQQTAMLRSIEGEIESFATTKDANGQPLYPHFDTVLGDIMVAVNAQIAGKKPIDLKAAYEKAIRMNDAVWAQTQAGKQAEAKKAADAKRAKEAADAKRAGFAPSGSGAVTSAGAVGSIADALKLAEQQLSR